MISLLSGYAWYEIVGPFSLVAALLASYWYIKTFIKSPHYKAARVEKGYFLTAVLLFYLVEGGPIGLIADHYLLSILTLQLSVIAFVVVPLIILSLPKQYIKALFWNHKRSQIAKLLFSHPWPLAVVFNGLVTLFFVPSVFNNIHGNLFLQFLAEMLIYTFAFFIWWIIIQPSSDTPGHSYLMRIGYVFFTALFLMPIGIYLLVLTGAEYPAYATVAGEHFPALGAVSDQQLAGGIIKAVQLTSFSFALYYLFRNWGIQEDEREGMVDEDTRVVQGIAIKVNNRNKNRRGRKR
ncbi:cytochrome c oxidase assembly protein [Virgibacillus kekensis]|uniref:Cytochrome c oxidase assembly protein n=1 Tax=Virgibacillus kekensis TaxID=202261 RepID=A0ABV9DGF7_9BACI